jgi:uncharacterized protein YjiS (DUF1127 family)
MGAQTSKSQLGFQLPEMLSYHSTWDDADYAPVLPARRPGFSKRIWAAFRERLRAYLDRRAAVRELSAMNDRELADLGLSRYDVGRIFDPEFAREYAARPAEH